MFKSLAELNLLKPLLADFIRQSPLRVISLVLLMVLNGLAASIGIMLIIPLLSSVGIHLDGTANSAAGWISELFTCLSALGIYPTLKSVLILYVVTITAVALLGYTSTLTSAKLRMQFIDQLRNRIFNSLLYAELQFLARERLSDFARMVTGQTQSLGYSIQQVLTLASRLILVLIYLAISLLLSPALTLIALLCAVSLVLMLMPLNSKIHKSGRIELSAYTGIFHSVFEQLSNLKVIKSYSAEQSYLEQMKLSSRQLETQQIKITQYAAISRLVNLVSAAVIFTLLFYISIKVLALPLSNLVLILIIFARLMPQVSALQTTMQQLVHSAPEYQDLIEKLQKLEKNQEQSQQQTAPTFQTCLSLEQLEYTYPDKNKAVFSGLNAQINKNKTIAICGPSGAGKSTLADIIAGLNAATKGQLLIDDTEINNSNRLAWRTKVAYVTQDVFLFNDSIKANLNWVSQQPLSDEHLWDYLKMAAADKFVEALPEGINTHIGDHGVKLSGGEKQRLALARALITEPEILILDEATSALDKENERRIMDAIASLEGELTIIVIAHNQSSIENISQRIVLDNSEP